MEGSNSRNCTFQYTTHLVRVSYVVHATDVEISCHFFNEMKFTTHLQPMQFCHFIEWWFFYIWTWCNNTPESLQSTWLFGLCGSFFHRAKLKTCYGRARAHTHHGRRHKEGFGYIAPCCLAPCSLLKCMSLIHIGSEMWQRESNAHHSVSQWELRSRTTEIRYYCSENTWCIRTAPSQIYVLGGVVYIRTNVKRTKSLVAKTRVRMKDPCSCDPWDPPCDRNTRTPRVNVQAKDTCIAAGKKMQAWHIYEAVRP